MRSRAKRRGYALFYYQSTKLGLLQAFYRGDGVWDFATNLTYKTRKAAIKAASKLMFYKPIATPQLFIKGPRGGIYQVK